MMKHTMIIAEAGVNHNGNLDTAFRMVDAACKAGADIIKFQTAVPEAVVSKFAPKADYQKKTTDKNESQLEMIKKIHLKLEEYIPLKEYCEKKRIRFLSTPFDLESIHFLNELGMDIWKIPSGEINNYPYLLEIAKTKKPVIMSTGMSTLDEIGQAIQVLRSNGTTKITLLHCTTEYPTAYEDVNLSAMQMMRMHFNCEIGYSDHTLGIAVPVAAVAMGAAIIEKHFTLDKKMQGPDHKASLEPVELREMIKQIRNIEKAIGRGVKEPAASEIKNIVIARKSIVAKRRIVKGEVFTEQNLTTKRPGNGISPMEWCNIIGTAAKRDYEEDEQI